MNSLTDPQKLAVRDYLDELLERASKIIGLFGAALVALLGFAGVSSYRDLTDIGEVKAALEKQVADATALLEKSKATTEAQLKSIQAAADQARSQSEILMSAHVEVARVLSTNPAFIELLQSQLLPVGTIVAWSGEGKPPPGWILCDGTDPRAPDLNGRFILGADEVAIKSGTMSKYDPRSSGYGPGSTDAASWVNALTEKAVTRSDNLSKGLQNTTHVHALPFYALRFIKKI